MTIVSSILKGEDHLRHQEDTGEKIGHAAIEQQPGRSQTAVQHLDCFHPAETYLSRNFNLVFFQIVCVGLSLTQIKFEV